MSGFLIISLICVVRCAREDNCLRCAGADAHQEEGRRENGEEGRAAVPRAVADEGARSAGKPVSVVHNFAF